MKRILRRWLGIEDLIEDVARIGARGDRLGEDLDSHWHGTVGALTTSEPRFPRSRGRIRIPGSAADLDYPQR